MEHGKYLLLKKNKQTKNQKTSCKQSTLVLIKVAKYDLKKQDPVGAHTIKNSYA